jgi:hydrogenase maturation protease
VLKTLILGAGNLLLSDEGFGVHFVRHLARHFTLPDHVELFDAGTLGILAAHKIEEAYRLYVIDTVLSAGLPGACVRYSKQEFVHGQLPLKLSPHQAGIQELLVISELRGRCPGQVFLWGVIPKSIEPGIHLSPELAVVLPILARQMATELLRLDTPSLRVREKA